MLCLDTSEFFCIADKLSQENSQYKAWIKQVKAVLQRFQKAKLDNHVTQWKDSIKTTSRILAHKNNVLKKNIKRKDREIQLLQNLLEEIIGENEEIINAIQVLNQPWLVDLETDKASPVSICKQSEESGYSSDTTDNTIKGSSSCSSIDTVLAEEPDALRALEEENTMYRKWIYSLRRQLSSNLSLKFIEPLKMLESLKNPAFDNLVLKQEYARKKSVIQYLQDQLEQVKEENVNIYTLYQENLEHSIYQLQLDKLEEDLQSAYKELEFIDSYTDKLKTTMCLE
jgi:hypothetical protein